MNTRAANAKKHPGKVVLDSSTRRPKEVVQAERASKAAEKERTAAIQEEGIKEVAAIENDSRKKKYIHLDVHQKDKPTIPRKTRLRNPPPTQAATPVNQGE